MSDISSPYPRVHSAGKSAPPAPERPKVKYAVKQEGGKFSVYYGDRRCIGFFVSRLSAQMWADSAQRMVSDPAANGEE